MKKTAIIIGAGPAGLTAAYYLLKKTDIKPVILEASEYIGGISRTAEYKGNRIDIGGHRFFSKNAEVNKLWTELLPLQGAPSYDDKKLGVKKPLCEGGPDPKSTDRVMLIRNRVSRILFLGKFFDYPISLKFATFKNMGFMRTCKAAFGYIKSCICRKKEDSLENFYINRFGKPLYEMFFKEYTTKLWGRSPSEISAQWGAQRVKGVSVLSVIANAITTPFRSKKNTETSLIEQFYYPKLGPGQLWEALADEIRLLGGEIILNSEVDKVTVEDGRVKCVYAGGKEYTGDIFMSTMPVKDLIAAMGSAPSDEVKRIASGLPYRDFMTVGLLCDKLKLKNTTKIKTLTRTVPDCWIYIQEPDAVVGRMQIFNNWSPYMVKNPKKTVWVGFEYFCSEGDKYWNMSDEEFIRFATDELVKLGIIERDAVKDALRIKVKKAYPAYFDTYSQFDTVREYLDSLGNLWCLGRNGQHRYNNMDHSMLTAIEAVNAIAADSSSKEAVWNVNTEQSYHESSEGESGSPSARKVFLTAASVILALLAIIAVGYYILFPSKGYYTADCADTILWANASYESGKILTEEFSYAALLPFGAQLWMTPLIAIFGMTMDVQIASMLIFMLLFVFSLVCMCRSLGWSTSWCAVCIAAVLPLLSAGDKLREIMWCHVIYYSLGLMILFLCIGLAARLSDYSFENIKQSPLRFSIYCALLFLLALGAATDGFQVLAITLVPLLGSVVATTMADIRPLTSKENAGAIITVGITSLGAIAGTLLLSVIKGDIYAGYADASSNFSSISSWTGNAQRFFDQYFTLTNVGVTADMPLAQTAGIISMLKIITGALVLVLPFAGLLSFGRTGDKYTRIAVSAHFVNSFVIMFVFICGGLSTSNWRLTPMLGTAIFASVATVRWLAGNYTPVGRRFCALLLAIILACGIVPIKDMFVMEHDYIEDNAHYILAQELEDRGLTYGYATFWNAGTVTLMSDSHIKVRNIEISGGEIKPYDYQSMDGWFEDQPGQEEYFVALTMNEYYQINYTGYWYVLTGEKLLYEFECGDYHVSVFSSNIF